LSGLWLLLLLLLLLEIMLLVVVVVVVLRWERGRLFGNVRPNYG
jgi:hypothetical protein